MRTNFILLLLSFIINNALIAQDYLPVPLDRSSFYDTDHIRTDDAGSSFVSYSCSQNCLSGIRIDSLNNLPDGTIYHFPDLLRESQNGWCEDDSWLGPNLFVQTNGTHVYFNGFGDSLFLNPHEGIGFQWNMYQVDDTT